MVVQGNIPDLLWRAFSSRRLTLILLAVIAVVLSCGAILPQIPAGTDVASREYDRWYGAIQARYRQWTDVLATLGLFSVLDSLWLKLTLALLMVNLSVCAIAQFEAGFRPPKCSAESFDRAFRRASQSATFVVASKKESVQASLRALLERDRYRVEVQQEDRASYLTASRFSLMRWGPIVAHGGLILVIVGLLLGTRVAWRERDIALSPGQAYQIQHVPSLSVRLDDFDAELYPHGAPRTYLARITLLEEGNEVKTGVALPNAPFRYDGLSLYQVSHGPLIMVRALDEDAQPIPLQALAPGATEQEEAALQLSDQNNEGYVTVPDHNLVLRIVYQSMAPPQEENLPSLLVQAYRGGMTDLVHSETLHDSATLEIDGNAYMVDWAHYAVLDITNDPSLSVILVGATTALVAAIASLHVPPRSIWGAVTDERQVLEIRVARLGGKELGGVVSEFDALMEQIERAIRG
jgi:cytochrome c biogenesis protein